MIKLLAFDLDDTLYPENDYVKSGITYMGDYLNELYGRQNFTDILELGLRSGYGKCLFNFALEKLNIPFGGETISNLISVYRNHRPTIELALDIKELLQYLNLKSFNLFLITDGYAQAQRLKVDALKIKPFFTKIYYTDDYGKDKWKPSTFIFKKCQSDTGISAANSIYVGDNWTKDFYAPNLLGWTTIGLQGDHKIHSEENVLKEYLPSIKVNSLSEILNHII